MIERYDWDFMRGREMDNATLHELAMFYLHKTAYEGITPEQVATEYYLAHDRISELLRQSNETPPEERPLTDGHAHGFKLEDTIPQ